MILAIFLNKMGNLRKIAFFNFSLENNNFKWYDVG